MAKILLPLTLLFCSQFAFAQDPLTEAGGTIFRIKPESEFLQLEQALSNTAKAKLDQAREERNKLGNKAKYSIGANRIMERDLNTLVGLNIPKPINKENFLQRENRNKSIITELGPQFPQLSYDNIDLRTISSIGCYWETSILTPVKDQETCGSCWAFSSAANWEHAYRKLYGTDLPIQDLSEQEILDCASADDGSDAGTCAGGWSDSAMEYMVRQAITTESSYPYREAEGGCSRIPGSSRSYLYGQVLHVERINGESYLYYPQISEIKAYIEAYGSVVTYLKAGTSSFYGYSGGVLNAIPSDNPDSETNSINVDHAVIIVGWCDDKNAWIIKNSWGQDWGPFGGYAYVDYYSYDIGKFVYYILPKQSQISQRFVPNLTDIGKSIKPDDLQFYGGQWGDQDEDGEDDLFISGVAPQQRSLLLRNDGMGGFQPASNSNYFFSTGRGLTWGDYNNDGKPDVFAPGGVFGVDSSATASIFKNKGTGQFQKIPLPRAATHGTWADTDGDGDLDLIMDNGSIAGNFLTLFRNDGNDAFSEILAFPGTTNALSFTTIAADLNNDRKVDLFSTGNGQRVLFKGNGNNAFSAVTNDPMISESNDMMTRGASFADFDNDGDLDLVLVTTNPQGTHKIYLNDGTGNFQLSPSGLGSSVFGGRGSVVFDYDSDGWMDLLITTGPEIQWNLFKNLGNGKFKKNLTEKIPAGSFNGASASDYNNDGKQDIFTAYFGQANNGLFSFGENSSNWIQIRLFGRETNRNALNSSVDVYAGGQRRHQQLLAVNGFANQNSMVLHFGLGKSTSVDSVIINWISGHRQVIYKPEINQKHLIRENLMNDRTINLYPTAIISGREWTTSNLRTSKFSNGQIIPEQQDPQIWGNLNGAGWTHHGNNAQNEVLTGKLYNYYAVESPNRLCPDGWIVPGTNDWNNMISSLGGGETAAVKLKDKKAFPGGSNESKFTAIPGGKRTPTGEYLDFTLKGYWWAAGQNIFTLSTNPQEKGVLSGFADKKTGASVRCIREQKDTFFEFKPLPAKTFGDSDFMLATKNSSGLPVKFLVADTAVAVVFGNQVFIKGAGTTTITANAPPDPEFKSVPQIVQTLQVTKASLNLKADNKSMSYGDAIPKLTFTSEGFRYNDNPGNLDSKPIISTQASSQSDAGLYEIRLQNSADRNYLIQQTNGTLTISKAPLVAQADPKTRKYGQPNPNFTLTYQGFKNGQTSSVLDVLPQVGTLAGITSDAGTYEITVTGGDDQNYTIERKSSTLTIEKADQVITFNQPTDVNETVGSFRINASITSTLPINLSSTNTDKITINNGNVSILKPGRVTILAEQPGDKNHLPAISISQSFCILPKQPTIVANGLGSASITLSSSADNGNQWYFNGTAILKSNGFAEDGNKKDLSVKEDGTYSVRVIVDDCQGILSQPLPLITTGIADRENDGLVSIYPNPATNELKIELSEQLKREKVRMVVTDLQGRRIQEVSILNGSIVYKVDALLPGTYLVTLKGKTTNIVRKFIKN